MSIAMRDMLLTPAVPISSYLALEKERLYHQFTTQVLSYITGDDHKKGEEIASFIHHVIFPLKQKLSPLRIVELIDFAVSKLSPADGMLLISEFEPAFIDASETAIRLAIVKSNTFIRSNELQAASDLLLGKVASTLEREMGVDLTINAAFNEARANYFRAANDPHRFYESLLLYLAYQSLNSIQPERQKSIAFELAVAGLVADEMFDFGDLLAVPILTTLDESQRWIIDFIEAASEGSFSMFEEALEQHKEIAQAVFSDRLPQLRLKMTLSSLVDIAFKLPPTDRRLSLDTIAKHCKVPYDQCERLIMKAMSFGLLRGSLDGIDNQLRVDWVKPRVVDPQRIEIVHSRFLNWSGAVRKLASQLEDSMPELLAA